jgi:mannose-6-phosphate isomerase class I
MVWGGSRLRSFYGRDIPTDKTGESWDITCRPAEMSVIENGPDAGTPLNDWFAGDREGTLGTRVSAEEGFPLLVKIIDAQDNLSVQVHPDDAYARAAGERGKSEMWYILHAPEDGCLIIGLKDGVTRETLERAVETGTVEECLHRLPVAKGDMIDIPAGLVHALTRGVMVAEIQQNSDVTYRLYDYNRLGLDGKPRALHVRDSLNVTYFDNVLPKKVVTGNTISNRYFCVTKIPLDGTLEKRSDRETFTLLTCVKGAFVIETPDGFEAELPLSRTAFIPASGKKFIVSDFSAIEARVIAWFAGEQWKLDVFNTHGKIYEASASMMFKVPIEKIVKGQPEYALRQRGKVAELGLGYAMGVDKFIENSKRQYKIIFTYEEAEDIVSRWRAANIKIVRLWYAIDRAAKSAMKDGFARLDRLSFTYSRGNLYIELPSGRKLCYYKAFIGENRFGEPSIHYYESKKEDETYGGKMTENIVQATARDCLAEAMLRLDAAGYEIVMHVHDEVVIEAGMGASVEDINRIMGMPVSWAEGLPLTAAGYETPYYVKD